PSRRANAASTRPSRGDIFTEQLAGHFHWTATEEPGRDRGARPRGRSPGRAASSRKMRRSAALPPRQRAVSPVETRQNGDEGVTSTTRQCETRKRMDPNRKCRLNAFGFVTAMLTAFFAATLLGDGSAQDPASPPSGQPVAEACSADRFPVLGG